MQQAMLLIGVMLMALLICLLFWRVSHVETLITECEQTLPRDKHCKLIAVPEEE